jgi:hypothetical protein
MGNESMIIRENGMMTNETKAQALGKTHWLKHKKAKTQSLETASLPD